MQKNPGWDITHSHIINFFFYRMPLSGILLASYFHVLILPSPLPTRFTCWSSCFVSRFWRAPYSKLEFIQQNRHRPRNTWRIPWSLCHNYAMTFSTSPHICSDFRINGTHGPWYMRPLSPISCDCENHIPSVYTSFHKYQNLTTSSINQSK